ncbi:MAG: NAD(P)H-binding protein [Kordiimonadaceae bacterium]|nr:NAD(P)H-binding protein [Kordiimonadaceae bacterium]MBO6568703.1 NAD(P)H-binding protein [Kordiimonadaceae bacterium]MBO6965321.1 NAD(P)H-binding protein [Kordiimonadaceae bacterium]
MSTSNHTTGPVLVTGGTGKTGLRVVNILTELDIEVRVGSRSEELPFDWDREATWGPCLEGCSAAYISYAPDLAMPGAPDAIEAFCRQAKASGVKRVVLLSGRGEVEAQKCEAIVKDSGLEWTIVRASWFNQNFSEGAFLPMIEAGNITLPAADVPEPFVDIDDIAEIAAEALASDKHVGELYEVTGPELLTFADLASILSDVVGREIQFTKVPHQGFIDEVAASGAPKDVLWMLDYLFATVLDGHNAYLSDGVERALGRQPTSFREYAEKVAASGMWQRSG